MGGTFSSGGGGFGKAKEASDPNGVHIMLTQDVFDRFQDMALHKWNLEQERLEQLMIDKEMERRQNSHMVASEDKPTILTTSEIKSQIQKDDDFTSPPTDLPASNVNIMESMQIGLEHTAGGSGDVVTNTNSVQLTPFSSMTMTFAHDHQLFQTQEEDKKQSDTLLVSGTEFDLDESGDLKTSSMEETTALDLDFLEYASKKKLLIPPISNPSSVPPFIPDFDAEIPDSLPLSELASMAKGCFSKLPEVESLKSGDIGEIHAEAVNKCQRINEFWAKKLDSRTAEVSTKMISDMQTLDERVERTKGQLSPPIPNACAEFFQRIAHCYDVNQGEVFKCRDIIKAFSNCVQHDLSVWTGMKRQ